MRLFLVLIVALLMGATFRSPNFVVDAPNAQVAQQCGLAAEAARKDKATLWIGQEMPQWSEPCPLTVKVTGGGSGGATSFAFDRGRVLGQTMTVEGRLDRILDSVIPHEVTHTVFAATFKRPIPRWADEGAAVLSEDQAERDRHDRMCRDYLNAGRATPLSRLFVMMEYPQDVMTLYSQGYSVTNWLVGLSSRRTFIDFVGHGMGYGWDQAASRYYAFNDVAALEKAWLAHLVATKKPASGAPASLTPECPDGMCPLRQPPPRPTYPTQPYQPPYQPPATQPPADTSALTTQINILRREVEELKARPCQQGPPGRDGKDGAPGPQGPPGTSPDMTAAIVAIQSIRKEVSEIKTTQGAPGPQGPAGKDADPAKTAALEKRLDALERAFANGVTIEVERKK